MSNRLLIAAALSTALVLGSSASAAGQSSTTRGFSLGLQAQGASLTVQNGDADTGGGGGIRFGYGVNRTITLFLAADGASVDAVNAPNIAGSWDMAHVDLGARFYFANALRRWIPYLEAALGARAVSVKDAIVNQQQQSADVSFSGGAFTLGGGIAFYVNQGFSLDAELKVSSGEFTNITAGAVTVGGLDIDATSSRFGLGFTWWP